MFQEIISIFSGYSIIPLLFMVVGLVLFCMQFFAISFNLYGVFGVVLTFGGMFTRMMMGGTLVHFGVMLIIVVLTLTIAFVCAKTSKGFNITSSKSVLDQQIQDKIEEINKKSESASDINPSENDTEVTENKDQQ